jgi:aldose 1-epimerase
MKTRQFGLNHQCNQATLYTFENKNGMVMEVTDFGATLYSLLVPTAKGPLHVVLGCDTPAGYEGPAGTFFGATVGRNANRICKGAFTLGGKTYQLAINNGPNNLHSGLDFWSFRVWQVKEVSGSSITFFLHSPDGDQGYPGAMDICVTYTLTEDNTVRIHYRGIPQAETLINLTNHSYFNLNGHDSGDILSHRVWLDADSFTRADETSIPTGEIAPVEGTPMDFRIPKTVGRDIGQDFEALNFGKGYDHNWCLNNGGKFAKVATLTGDQTGLAMDVYTDLPGVQIYTGNFQVAEPGKGGFVYRHRAGICFETQYYPDSVNHPNFPSPILRAGEIYRTATEFRFR